MGLKLNLLFSTKKNREIDGAKKSKVEREKFKHIIASLNKKGCSKHPEKINRDVKNSKLLHDANIKTNFEFERSFYFL